MAAPCSRVLEVFEAEEIVYALSRQLSWTHLRSLIYIDDPLKREFYLEMCRSEGWSTRTLQGRLESMLFERTALLRKPDELLTSELATLRGQGVLSPNLVLKDPYVLDFLGLRDRIAALGPLGMTEVSNKSAKVGEDGIPHVRVS